MTGLCLGSRCSSRCPLDRVSSLILTLWILISSVGSNSNKFSNNSNQALGLLLQMKRRVMIKYLYILTKTNREMLRTQRCKRLFNKPSFQETIARMCGNWSIQEEKKLSQKRSSSWQCSCSVKLKMEWFSLKKSQLNSLHQHLIARWSLFPSSSSPSFHKPNSMHHHQGWSNNLHHSLWCSTLWALLQSSLLQEFQLRHLECLLHKDPQWT